MTIIDMTKKIHTMIKLYITKKENRMTAIMK